jgi:hypothetical protein
VVKVNEREIKNISKPKFSFFFFGKENHENIKIQEESSEEMELNQVYF